MITNRYSEQVEVLATINPASYTTAQNSAWVSAALHNRYAVVLHVGTISAGGTLDMKIQRATDASGTGAQDIPGKSIVQMTQAGGDSNKVVVIEVRPEELGNGFTHIRAVVTPATAASILGVQVLGVVGEYQPVPQTNWAQAI